MARAGPVGALGKRAYRGEGPRETREMARAGPVGAVEKRAYNGIFVSVGAVSNRADPNKPRKEMAL